MPRHPDIERLRVAIAAIRPDRIGKLLRGAIARDPAALRDAIPRGAIDLAKLHWLIVDDKPARDAVDAALQHPPHRHRGSRRNPPAPSGNSTEAALRRLRKDPRPFVQALRRKVLAGKMSAHRAAIEAGYRKAK